MWSARSEPRRRDRSGPIARAPILAYARWVSELGLVLLLASALALSGWICAVLPWETVFGAGLLLAALGIVAGVPAGVVYHARLYQALAPRDALPARWWLRPVELHARLL